MESFKHDPECPGCLGILYSCGHGFVCAYSEAAQYHDCHDWLRDVLWMVFIGLVVTTLILLLVR